MPSSEQWERSVTPHTLFCAGDPTGYFGLVPVILASLAIQSQTSWHQKAQGRTSHSFVLVFLLIYSLAVLSFVVCSLKWFAPSLNLLCEPVCWQKLLFIRERSLDDGTVRCSVSAGLHKCLKPRSAHTNDAHCSNECRINQLSTWWHDSCFCNQV